MNKWSWIVEEYPEEFERVLISDCSYISIGYWNGKDWHDDEDNAVDVIFWMNLPEMPSFI